MGIYGRDELLEVLLERREGLIVLTGDSGVGKTSVLRTVQQRENTRIAVTGTLMSHEGALETVIAEQLADACAAYLRTRTDPESQATQLAKRLVARAAKTSAIEMAGLVAKQLLGILASRLGPDAAAAIGRVLEDLTHTADEALERRLRLQSGADALRQLMGLAAETVSAIGDVLVVLDGGERLSDSDFALLRDLPGFLPARVTVLLGLTTADTAQHEKADLLGISGGLVIELPALRLEHIQTWLADQTLPAEHAKEVLTRTNGYPLLVDSAIAYLLAGKSLSEAPSGRHACQSYANFVGSPLI